MPTGANLFRCQMPQTLEDTVCVVRSRRSECRFELVRLAAEITFAFVLDLHNLEALKSAKILYCLPRLLLKRKQVNRRTVDNQPVELCM